MQGADVERAGAVFDEGDGGATPAAAAMGGGDEKLINESVAAVILEAEAQGEADVADRGSAVEDEPCAAERWIAEKLLERRAGGGFVERIEGWIVIVKGAHETEKSRDVGGGGETKDRGGGRGVFRELSRRLGHCSFSRPLR